MPRRAGLDRGSVVRAAAALADESPRPGETVSLTRLADRLGVRTPSLYKHVEGLPALERELSLLGTTCLADHLADAAIGRSCDAAIRSIADAYRSFARQHPGLYVAALRAPRAGDTELEAAAERAVGFILRVLEAYGLRGEDALHAVRALRSLLHGFIALEAAGGFGLPLDLDESYRRLVTMFLDSVRGSAQTT